MYHYLEKLATRVKSCHQQTITSILYNRVFNIQEQSSPIATQYSPMILTFARSDPGI